MLTAQSNNAASVPVKVAQSRVPTVSASVMAMSESTAVCPSSTDTVPALVAVYVGVTSLVSATVIVRVVGPLASFALPSLINTVTT